MIKLQKSIVFIFGLPFFNLKNEPLIPLFFKDPIIFFNFIFSFSEDKIEVYPPYLELEDGMKIPQLPTDDLTEVDLQGNIIGIDIEEILKEIDGEVLYKLDEQSFMVKIKDEAPEIRRVLTMLTNENTSFYLGNKFEEKDGIIRIGESNFEENKNSFNISKDTFIYGEIDSPKVMGFEGIEAKIQGENKKVNMKVTIPVEVLKEITREY